MAHPLVETEQQGSRVDRILAGTDPLNVSILAELGLGCCTPGPSLVSASGGLLSAAVRASHRGSFFHWSVGSRHVGFSERGAAVCCGAGFSPRELLSLERGF